MNEFVRKGYDDIAEAYAAQRDTRPNLPYIDRFLEALPGPGPILDLGCGPGIVSELLRARGLEVIGIDISEKQIELARRRNPGATFLVADMQALTEGQFNVSGVISLYAIFHLPREAHQQLFRVLRTFLPTEGSLLVSMGEEEWEGVESDFFGTRMYWSNFGRAENRALIEAAGFLVLLDEIDASVGERHQLILAKAR